MPIGFLPKLLREAAKAFAFRYTKFGAPSYPYKNVEPIELALLINEIERLKNVAGNIAEIGVARGMTTRFICQHITSQKLENSLTLFALDTFTSFTRADLDYEVSQRGKSRSALKGFDYNDYEVWARNFSQYPFVKAIQTDCSTFDYSQIAPLKLAFLDVDLYLPTKYALPKIYDVLVTGGVIILDDVLDNANYDGAYQAYMEFCEDLKLAPTIIGNKCGLVFRQ